MIKKFSYSIFIVLLMPLTANSSSTLQDWEVAAALLRFPMNEIALKKLCNNDPVAYRYKIAADLVRITSDVLSVVNNNSITGAEELSIQQLRYQQFIRITQSCNNILTLFKNPTDNKEIIPVKKLCLHILYFLEALALSSVAVNNKLTSANNLAEYCTAHYIGSISHILSEVLLQNGKNIPDDILLLFAFAIGSNQMDKTDKLKAKEYEQKQERQKREREQSRRNNFNFDDDFFKNFNQNQHRSNKSKYSSNYSQNTHYSNDFDDFEDFFKNFNQNQQHQGGYQMPTPDPVSPTNHQDFQKLKDNFNDFKKMYRSATLKWHPDKNNGSEESAKNMSLLTDLFNLVKEAQGLTYDTFIDNKANENDRMYRRNIKLIQETLEKLSGQKK